MTTTYLVRSGDTLGKIAEFHKIPLEKLLELNPLIDDPDLIFVGQRLNVPEVPEKGPSIHLDGAPAVDGPDWYRIALREMLTGVEEFSGPADNPRIVEYHQATSLKATDDEVPWCSSFVNWCMLKAGVERTNSAAARSWMKWGKALAQPRLGCVAVFSRGSNPAKGHVAFFKEVLGNEILVLGGNQSDQVNITGYSAQRLLGYRWPS